MLRYQTIKDEERVVNLFTIFKKFLWPSVLHSTDGFVGSYNGGSMKARYGWRKWEQWCVAFDMEVGQVFTYVDGDEDGELKINANTTFDIPLERANMKVKEPNLITDVIVGCFLTEDTAGNYKYFNLLHKSFAYEIVVTEN